MGRMTTAGLIAVALQGAPVGVDAYDGSPSGPADADVRLVLRSPKALSYLLTAPSQLGLARAYVSGELEILAFESGLCHAGHQMRQDLAIGNTAHVFGALRKESFGFSGATLLQQHVTHIEPELSRHPDVAQRFEDAQSFLRVG